MKLQITSLFMLLTNVVLLFCSSDDNTPCQKGYCKCVLAAATCLHKAPYDIDVVGLTQEQCQ